MVHNKIRQLTVSNSGMCIPQPGAAVLGCNLLSHPELMLCQLPAYVIVLY